MKNGEIKVLTQKELFETSGGSPAAAAGTGTTIIRGFGVLLGLAWDAFTYPIRGAYEAGREAACDRCN